MGQALELVTATATAAPAAGAAMTAAAGNSLTIREAKGDIFLLSFWTDVQTAGFFRITSPLLHDNTIGMRVRTGLDNDPYIKPGTVFQPLQSQDTLSLTIGAGGVAGDIESAGLLIWYEDLLGVSGNFISAEELESRSMNIYSFTNLLALGTAGGYSGEEAINAEFDALKANTDYALIGYDVDLGAASIRYRATDWGNLGVGGPVAGEKWIINDWFYRMARIADMPLIPVFNSSNKSLVLLDGVQDENGGDVTVTTYLVQLSKEKAAKPKAKRGRR